MTISYLAFRKPTAHHTDIFYCRYPPKAIFHWNYHHDSHTVTANKLRCSTLIQIKFSALLTSLTSSPTLTRKELSGSGHAAGFLALISACRVWTCVYEKVSQNSLVMCTGTIESHPNFVGLRSSFLIVYEDVVLKSCEH